MLPENYRASYVEVRDCRRSGDHDFEFVRVLADPIAAAPYMTRSEPIPEGGFLLKEQYDPSDETCSGDIIEFSLAKRLPFGSAPEALDYTWQRVYANGDVENDVRGCINCHTRCGVPPDGFDGTCALP
jgi:hypothetical protein